MLTSLRPLEETGVTDSRGRLQGVKVVGILLTNIAECGDRCEARFCMLMPRETLSLFALPVLRIRILGMCPSMLLMATVFRLITVL